MTSPSRYRLLCNCDVIFPWRSMSLEAGPEEDLDSEKPLGRPSIRKSCSRPNEAVFIDCQVRHLFFNFLGIRGIELKPDLADCQGLNRLGRSESGSVCCQGSKKTVQKTCETKLDRLCNSVCNDFFILFLEIL